MLAYPSRHHLQKRRRREIHQQRNAGFSVHSNLDLDISVPDSDGGGNAGLVCVVFFKAWSLEVHVGVQYLDEHPDLFVSGL